MKKETWLFIVAVVIFTGVLALYLRGERGLRKERGLPAGRQGEVVVGVSPSPTAVVIPTKTEEEKEIIRNIETLEVKITDSGFEPASLIIKPNDQVDWVNETSEAHKVVGEGWGGVVIRPERRFTQSFEKAGIYPYECELHPEEKGQVVVE